MELPSINSSHNNPHSFRSLAPNWTSNVEEILQLLQAESRGDDREIIEKFMIEKDGLTLTVNAFVVTGAFIASVQAQVISLTWTINDTNLLAASNWFSFVGLTLDIVGTSFGVIHAIRLQQTIQSCKRLLIQTNHLQEVRQLLSEITSPIPAQGDIVRTDEEVRAAIAKLLQEELARQKDIWMLRRLPSHSKHNPFRTFPPIYPLSRLLDLNNLFLEQLEVLDSGVGTIPLGAMMFGILFLIFAVLCFAGGTQPRRVWAACVAVTSIVAGYSVAAVMAVPIQRIASKVKFRRVDQKIQELSRT